MVDQIASTRNREDFFIICKPFYYGRESGLRGCVHILQADIVGIT